jgi:patatin-like phospholipase/acyl hydrolase
MRPSIFSPSVRFHLAACGQFDLRDADGGGVRGVSSLIILDKIMNNIKDMYNLAEVPKPCDFFHMIGGTSTGG